MKNQWLEIDKEGLRKSLGQKDKVFLLTEMVSNAWDENITQVEVSLSCPDANGHSWLRVIDNSPTGWADLSHSHTMFAESAKKGKSEKRGRFNAGEKDVLALAIEARLTTIKGQVLFNEDGTRQEGTETREVGSEFVAKFQLTLEEYEHICNQAKLLIPPNGITTLFNGHPIQCRKPCGSFTEFLPLPLADKEGVMRNTERKTKVNLYERLPGEVAMIYEMGIPIVELGDDKWHVNVMQKVPLSRDRDNVNPAYLRKIRVGVLNAKFDELDKDDAAAGWVREAVGNTKSADEAVIRKSRRGEDGWFIPAVLQPIPPVKPIENKQSPIPFGTLEAITSCKPNRMSVVCYEPDKHVALRKADEMEQAPRPLVDKSCTASKSTIALCADGNCTNTPEEGSAYCYRHREQAERTKTLGES